MTIETNELGVTILTADSGKAICRVAESGPTTIDRVALSKSDVAANWKDCDYCDGLPDEATEADKDAALTTLGVDMTEGVAQ